jgi:spermidine synthase
VRRPTDRPRFALAALLVAASGACSLVYQVVWERALRYHFGGDSVSSAIVTGTFLLGLGLGAVVFARRHSRPFRVYALVEAAIGVYGVLSLPLLVTVAPALGGLFGSAPAAAEGVRPAVVVACVLFLVVPCVLIGGTTPLMFDCFVRPGGYGARAVGALYGLNTLGAAVGVLAAPFALLNRLSLPRALAVIGAINLVLAIALWAYGGRAAPRETARASGEDLMTPAPAGAWPPLALAFVSGLIALSFEVVLIRALFVQNPSSPYNFPAMLVPFLLAIAVSSSRFTRLPREDAAALVHRIGLLLAAGAGAMLAAVAASGGLALAGYRVTRLGPRADEWALVAHATLLAGSLPLCTGAILPLALRLAARTAGALPARTGPVVLASAAGSFAGALLTQFVGFPTLGTRGVVLGLWGIGLAAGGVCVWTAGVWRAARRGFALAALALAAVTPALVPEPLWDVFVSGVASPGAERVEGVTGVAAIDWQPDGGGDLLVNGQYMSRIPDHPRHVRLVSFPLALPRRERVLLLGLGGGGMVRHLVRDPTVQSLDVVDWSHELPRLLDGPRARRLLDDALRHPKVRLCRCDARVALTLYPAGAFDVVIDNLTIAHWVGATGVKSVEYFRRVRRVLAPDGVLVYQGNWGPARKAILAGLVDTFPAVSVQSEPAASDDEVVLASAGPVALDPDHARRVLTQLARVTGIGLPADTLAGLTRVSRAELGGIEPVRDDHLRYEYRRRPGRGLERQVRRWLWSRP